ncbi:MAG: hypothetical protein QF473_24225, partial [Planctomycetota bacterium]|nr:hypothetical protein [Planctomycetota bacterium]
AHGLKSEWLMLDGQQCTREWPQILHFATRVNRGSMHWMLAASAPVKPRYCRADEISLISGACNWISLCRDANFLSPSNSRSNDA